MTHDVAVHTHDPDPPAGPQSWTNIRVALLIRLRGEGIKRGFIADKINKETGSNFTRSAVAGKIDRIYQAAKPNKTPEEKAATIRAQRDRDNEKKRLATQARLSAKQITINKAPSHPPRPFLCQPAPDIQPRNLTLFQLEKGDCRFPYGDDPALMVFCGHPIPEWQHLSFCPAHMSVCTRRRMESGGRAA